MDETTQPPLKFLPICEGNRLAAIILDYLYRYSLIFDCVEKYAPFRGVLKGYAEEDDDYYYDPSAFKEYLHYEVNVEGELEFDSFEDFRSKLISIAYEVKTSTNAQLVEAINFLCHKKRFISLSLAIPLATYKIGNKMKVLACIAQAIIENTLTWLFHDCKKW